MCTWIIDYMYNIIFILDIIIIIVDLMHSRIFSQHLCSLTITWLNKLLSLLLLLLKDFGNEVSFMERVFKGSRLEALKD